MRISRRLEPVWPGICPPIIKVTGADWLLPGLEIFMRKLVEVLIRLLLRPAPAYVRVQRGVNRR